MTKQETAMIITMLQSNYPDAHKNMDTRLVKGMVDTWYLIFRNDPLELVQGAVLAHMATDTNPFMPNVGVIRKKMLEIAATQEQKANDITPHEAWMQVYEAICNSAYHSREEFEKLPTLTQRLIGSPSQLFLWATTENLNMEVVGANFQKSFAMAQGKQNQELAEPDIIKQIKDRIQTGRLEQTELKLLEKVS